MDFPAIPSGPVRPIPVGGSARGAGPLDVRRLVPARRAGGCDRGARAEARLGGVRAPVPLGRRHRDGGRRSCRRGRFRLALVRTERRHRRGPGDRLGPLPAGAVVEPAELRLHHRVRTFLRGRGVHRPRGSVRIPAATATSGSRDPRGAPDQRPDFVAEGHHLVDRLAAAVAGVAAVLAADRDADEVASCSSPRDRPAARARRRSAAGAHCSARRACGRVAGATTHGSDDATRYGSTPISMRRIGTVDARSVCGSCSARGDR